MNSKYVHDEKRIHQELAQGLCTFPFMQFLSGGYTPSWRPAWRPACCLKMGDLFALVMSLTTRKCQRWTQPGAAGHQAACGPGVYTCLGRKEGRKEGIAPLGQLFPKCFPKNTDSKLPVGGQAGKVCLLSKALSRGKKP